MPAREPRLETTDLTSGLSLLRWGDSEQVAARQFGRRYRASFDDGEALEPATVSLSGLPERYRVTRQRLLALLRDDWVAFRQLTEAQLTAIFDELGVKRPRKSSFRVGSVEFSVGRSEQGWFLKLRGPRAGAPAAKPATDLDAVVLKALRATGRTATLPRLASASGLELDQVRAAVWSLAGRGKVSLASLNTLLDFVNEDTPPEALFAALEVVPTKLQAAFRLPARTLTVFEIVGRKHAATLQALVKRCRDDDPRALPLIFGLALHGKPLSKAERSKFLSALSLMALARTAPPRSAGTEARPLSEVLDLATRANCREALEQVLCARCVSEEAAAVLARGEEFASLLAKTKLPDEEDDAARLLLLLRLGHGIPGRDQSAVAEHLVSTWLHNRYAWPKTLETLMDDLGPVAPVVARAFRAHEGTLSEKHQPHAFPLSPRLQALGL